VRRVRKKSRVDIPPPSWNDDQPPIPKPYEFRSGYHDHIFKSFASPVTFAGFTLKRIRNAIDAHRQGLFIESSVLWYSIMSFGPVLAAVAQRIAPILSLPRQINAGTRGLSKLIGEEIEEQIAPREGLAPSAHFPATLYGAMAIDLAGLGFSVLQHIDGDPNPETGIRQRYTRRWPTWATQYYPYRRTFVAITNDGPVDIVNDGKFTLIGDLEEPHLLGAIVALGEEAFDGKSTQRARSTYVDRYGGPKWVATMPPNTPVNSKEGDAMFEALRTIRGPEGFGAIPNGATFEPKSISASQNAVFSEALASNWQYVAAVILGSDGTMTRGTGVYSAPIFAGVRRDLVDRDLKSIVRGTNQGHIVPYVIGNYRSSIETIPNFILPVIDIPLPDPEADVRIKSYSDRMKAFHEVIAAERNNGCSITQDRIDQLAAKFSIDPPTLSSIPLSISQADLAKVVKVDEARDAYGLKPIGDDRGEFLIAELDAPAQTTEEIEDGHA